MDGYSIVLLLVLWSLLVCFIAVKIFPHTVTVKEAALGGVVQLFVVGTVYFLASFYSLSDYQVLNGSVTSKERVRVSCEHSYRCNCVTECSTDSQGNKSCHEVCQTCYDHPFDYSWRVYSNVGSSTIRRLDAQGLKEPPRWTEVVVGEPYSEPSSYQNYIKAGKFSLFNKATFSDESIFVPEIPRVYDYYRLNRVVNISPYKQTLELNNALDVINSQLGPINKVNIIFVLHDRGTEYMEQLKVKLLGGKINELIVGIKTDEQGNIKHVHAFSWSKSDLVHVELREKLLAVKNLANVDRIKGIVFNTVRKNYVPRSIEEFAYLKDEIELPRFALIFVLIVGMLFPFVHSYIAHREDIA